MQKDLLDGVMPFLAVAEHLNFTKAASVLGVTPTTVSNAINQIESRLGVVLFQRTTRNVALTEVGITLYKRLQPAAADMNDAFEDLGAYQTFPTGTLKLTMSRSSMETLMEPVLIEFRRRYADVSLEVSIDDGIVDLIGERFDAGVRLGESVEKDMVAIRLTPEISWYVVGSPEYFKRAGTPSKPEELIGHEVIQYRFVSSGALHRWEFVGDRRRYAVEPTSHLIVNDRATLMRLALRGVGLAYVSDREAAGDVAAGKLDGILGDFIPKDSGLYLYFPFRTQAQPKLRALVDLVREMNRST